MGVFATDHDYGASRHWKKDPKNRAKAKGCPKCGQAAIRCIEITDRPRFTCDGCKKQWSCGTDGGIYTNLAMRYHIKNNIAWPVVKGT